MSETARWLEAFPPAAFAMVMARGIVSIGARVLGYDMVGWALYGINAVAADGRGKRSPFQLEALRDQPEVIEVLQPAIRDPKGHYRLEFLSNDCLD